MKRAIKSCLMMILFFSMLSLFPLISPFEKAAVGQQLQENWRNQSIDQPNNRPEDRQRPPRRKGGPLMRVLDADRNAVLSAEEIKNAAAALQKLDLDGDGNVTRYELHQPYENFDSATMDEFNRKQIPREYNDYDYNKYKQY